MATDYSTWAWKISRPFLPALKEGASWPSEGEATEIGPHDTPQELTEEELRTGWYRPGRLPPEVSTIGGKLVDTQTALAMYKKGLVSEVPFHI